MNQGNFIHASLDLCVFIEHIGNLVMINLAFIGCKQFGQCICYKKLPPNSSGFADVFDVDYFIQQMDGFVRVVKELPPELASKEPFHVDCSKRKGQFDYVESILPSLIQHHYIAITPAMSQRRDR